MNDFLFTFYWATQLLKCIIFDLLIEMRVCTMFCARCLKERKNLNNIKAQLSLILHRVLSTAVACLCFAFLLRRKKIL